MSDIRTIFKPHRGRKSTFTTGDKSSTILENGEIFFEYPDNGNGTGRGRIMMGDGESTYATMSSNNKYFIPFTEDEIINHPGTANKTISGSSYINTSTINTYLNNAKSGNNLKTIIHNLREAIYSNACNIELCRSYVGMIIHSTLLNTSAKVIAIYGGTTWISLSGYMLRGATTSVTANKNQNDGGADSVTVSSVASHNHTQNAHKHTQDSHNHTQNSHNHTQNAHSHQLRTKHSDGTVYTGEVLSCAITTSGRLRGYTESTTPTNNATTATNIATTATNQNTTATNIASGANYSVATLPKYKNVYIWERTV